jgi:flagellar biogenesis protein FliO
MKLYSRLSITRASDGVMIRAALIASFISVVAWTNLSAQQPDSESQFNSTEWLPPHAAKRAHRPEPEMPDSKSQIVNADYARPVADSPELVNVQDDLSQLLQESKEVHDMGSATHLARSETPASSNWIEPEHKDESTSPPWSAQIANFFGSTDLAKMLGSLALVLGGYFGFVWLIRKLNPRSATGLPQEAVDVIGCAPFGPRRTLQLVRLGTKLLLLVNGPDGTNSIGEITDPREVEYLASLCSGRRNARRTDSVAALRRLVSQVQPPSAPSSKQSTPITKPSLEQIVLSLQDVIRHTSGGTVFEA